MLIEALVPRVRRGLGVAASYDNEEIPDIIRSAIRRLLRDYNFPLTRRRQVFDLALNDVSFQPLPGFRKEFELRFYDPVGAKWSDPLKKVEHFVPPPADGITSHYWFEGNLIYINQAVAQDGVGKQLVMFYQSMDVETNGEQLLDQFEDAVAYLAITRGAADMRKDEVMKMFGPLWGDEQTSLAIYLNELEWDNVEVRMKEPRVNPAVRYPTGATGV